MEGGSGGDQILRKIDWLHQSFSEKLVDLQILKTLQDEVTTLHVEIVDGRKQIEKLVVASYQGRVSQNHHQFRPESEHPSERTKCELEQFAYESQLDGQALALIMPLSTPECSTTFAATRNERSSPGRRGESPGRRGESPGRRGESPGHAAESGSPGVHPMLNHLGSNASLHSAISFSTIGDAENKSVMCKCLGRLRLHPDSILRSLWDFIGCFALAFDSIAIPFILAWDPDTQGFLQFGVIFTAVFWTFDIIVILNTSFYNKEGSLQTQFSKIFFRYLRTSMVLDMFICTFDWAGIILEAQSKENPNGGLALLRLIKINHRIIRTIRVFRVTRLWEKSKRLSHFFLSNTSQVIVQVMVIFLFILWQNHVITCIWYAVGAYGAKDTGQSWLEDEVNTLNPMPMREASVLYQYTTAYHWSISQFTPGSLSVMPMNSLERSVNIFTLLFGLLFCSSLISRISALMVQLHLSNQERNTIMRRLRQYVRQKRISPSIGQQIERQVYSVLTTTRPLTMNDLPQLSHLSKTLRGKLKHDIYKPHLMRQRVFMCLEDANSEVLRSVCKALESLQLSPNEDLFREGESTRMSYILMQGRLAYVQGQGFAMTDDRRIVEASNFWVSSGAFWTDWITKGYLEADSICELICIDAIRILAVISAQNTRMRSFVKNYQETFVRLLEEGQYENANDLDELVDHALVVFFLPLRNKLDICDPLLEQIKSRNWLSWGNGHKNLESEISQGKCVLAHGQDSSIARVVVVVALRLLGPDEEMIVKIGDIVDEIYKPMCRLPGSKITPGDVPSVAFNRLLSHVREASKDDCDNVSQVEQHEFSIETSTSAALGVFTQYNRNVFQVRCSNMKAPPRIQFSKRFSFLHSSGGQGNVYDFVRKCMPWLERHVAEHIFLAQHGSKGAIYARIYSDEFDRLQQHISNFNGSTEPQREVLLKHVKHQTPQQLPQQEVEKNKRGKDDLNCVSNAHSPNSEENSASNAHSPRESLISPCSSFFTSPQDEGPRTPPHESTLQAIGIAHL